MRQTGGGNTLDFFYDESGHPYALKYNGTTYYYVTNLQGDVLKIVYKDEDDAIQVAASYSYDPYGKVLSATGALAEINPLRYRGYVYDSETGFYYLQSRYYDPAICRFINADSYASTGQGFLGYNMFTYCNNKPVSNVDPTGHMIAYDMFEEAIFGDGSRKEYDEDSKLSKALAKSKALQTEFEENLAKFIDSGAIMYGTYFGSISTYDGETLSEKDLALSVGAARYIMTITREHQTSGFLWWKKEEVRYVATIIISDVYDFTEWRNDSSFGSIMNNLALIGQIVGLVKPYHWSAEVVIRTEWE